MAEGRKTGLCEAIVAAFWLRRALTELMPTNIPDHSRPRLHHGAEQYDEAGALMSGALAGAGTILFWVAMARLVCLLMAI